MRIWWEHVMAGWNYWFSTIDWGTLPAWVGSCLSGLSILLALYIILRDRRKADLADVNAVSVWTIFSGSSDNGAPMKYLASIYLHNGMSRPMPMASIFTDKEAGTYFSQWFSDSDKPLEPGVTHKHEIKKMTSLAGLEFYVEFVDSAGRVWIKSAKTGKVVGKKIAKKLSKQNSASEMVSYSPEW